MPATRRPFNAAPRAGLPGCAHPGAATNGGSPETSTSAVARRAVESAVPGEVRSPSPMLRRAISRATRLLIAESREEIPAEGQPAARWRLRALFDSARRMVRQHRIVRIFKAELEEGRQRRSAAAEADAAATEERWEALRHASDLAEDFIGGLSAVEIRGGGCVSKLAESIVLHCQLLRDALDGLSESCLALLRELEILRAELSGGKFLASTIPRLRAIIEAVRACLREHAAGGGAGVSRVASGKALVESVLSASTLGDSRKEAGCETRCEKTLRSAADAESAFSDKAPDLDSFDEAGRLRRGETLQGGFSEPGPPNNFGAFGHAAPHEASDADCDLEYAPSLRSSVDVVASQTSSWTCEAATELATDDFARLTGAGNTTVNQARAPSADAQRKVAQPRTERITNLSPSMSTRESGHRTSTVNTESRLSARLATRSTSKETDDVVEPILRPSLQTLDGQNQAQQTSPQGVPLHEPTRRPRRYGPAPPLHETIPPTPEARSASALRMSPSPPPEASPARSRHVASPASPSFTPAPRDRYARSPRHREEESRQPQAGPELTVRAPHGSVEGPVQALAQEPPQAPQHVPTQEPQYGPLPATDHWHQTQSVGKAWATPNTKGSSRPRSKRRNRSRAGLQSDDAGGRAQAHERAVAQLVKPVGDGSVTLRWRIPSVAKGGA